MKWTTDQIFALAPDAGSAKAGQRLANARAWPSLGYHEQAAWGECQGSGKLPYQTRIDLTEPAFRCSCPSRKFPCKHALGLFLLLANQPQAFTQTVPPPWVTEWLNARAKRADAKPEAREKTDSVIDVQAQAKRAAARERRVAEGLAELERWLRDLVRNGLAAAQSEPSQFWERPAARLVDAQAPGLARLIREMASTIHTGEGWESRLLERIGDLHLLLEGYKHIETLPTASQADVRAMIGWTINQEELLKEAGLRDQWLVLGGRLENDDRLRVQRRWLYGLTTQRYALLLHFAHATQPLDTSIIPGTTFDAELVFYPSASPLRAVLKTRHTETAPLDHLPGHRDIATALRQANVARARCPWLERMPIALACVTPVSLENQFALRDETGCSVLLHPRFEQAWTLLALSGGHPISVFGEWAGDRFWPLSADVEQRLTLFSEVMK